MRGVGRQPARQVNLGEFGNPIGAKLPKLSSVTYWIDIVSMERYVCAAQETGSRAKCCCIAPSRIALSSAAMIMDWSRTRYRWPTDPVVGLTASKKPAGP